MTISTLAAFVESWAPKEIAWEHDNVGLQLGDPASEIRGILLTLDVSRETLEEARNHGANLIISHHPLIFRPIRTLVSGTPVADCVARASQLNIAIYAAHTNADFTTGGTSAVLAGELGLEEIRALLRTSKTKKKIVTYVPARHTEDLVDAMAESGAGTIGNYDHCSFRVSGTGTFRGNKNSNPRRGKKGRVEHVDETRLEMIVDTWNVEPVLRAMLRSHPYEEVAYEIYPVENVSPEYGMGAIGKLKQALRPRAFLQLVRTRLGADGVRYGGTSGRMIRRVAVCGGSGSELLEEAVRQDADAFVTADIKYHTFRDAGNRILLVDAGHFETEFPLVRSMTGRIRRFVRDQGSTIPVVISRRSLNPIMYA